MEDAERAEQPGVVIDLRTTNLDILNNYIQRQRALLEKIKLDITKFEELKSSAERDPLGRLNCIVHDYNQDIYGERVDELVEDVRCDEGEESITDTIDWKLFEGHDSSSLCELAVKTRYAHSSAMFLPCHYPPLPTPSASKHPPTTPGLPKLCESEMMARVRAAKSKMLDPVLERNAEFLASLPPDIDEETAKGSEKNKGRTSNGKHKTHGNRRKKHVGSNTTIRPRGPGGVFVKRSALAEGKSTPEFATPTTPASANSAELARCMSSVSSLGDGEGGRAKRQRRPSARVLDGIPPLGSRRSSRRQSSALSTPAGSASPAPEVTQPPRVRLVIRLPPLSSLARSKGRDSTTPFASTSSSMSTNLNTSSGSTVVTPDTQSFGHVTEKADGMDVDEVKEEEVDHYDWNGLDNVGTSDDEVDDEKVEQTPLPSTSKSISLAGATKNGKARSKTFNQSWSVSEQHLLDRLLEQFPDGTKNRWARISKAMDGRRTARQVASRVQKYFAKMKKFGIDMI